MISPAAAKVFGDASDRRRLYEMKCEKFYAEQYGTNWQYKWPLGVQLRNQERRMVTDQYIMNFIGYLFDKSDKEWELAALFEFNCIE